MFVKRSEECIQTFKAFVVWCVCPCVCACMCMCVYVCVYVCLCVDTVVMHNYI